MKKDYKLYDLKNIIELAQKDDYEALEELIKRKQGNVYAMFYFLAPERKDLNDLTQEALYKMAHNLKKLKNINSFKSWLNQIVTNIFYDELRKKNRQLNVIPISYNLFDDDNNSIISNIPDKKHTPQEKSLSNELDGQIKSSIHNLPEQYRIAIALREFQGLSYEEIAALTKSTIGTVKSRIARARLKLQESLKHYIA